MERYEIEDKIKELASQCKCYSYNGPCRFCREMEKLERKADRMDAEEQVLNEIFAWLKGPRFLAFSNRELLDAITYGLATKEWKKKDAEL